MAAPLVSVIIPAYNSGEYIPDSLDSVFNQTFKDLEIIVVDDGSTDHTLEVVERFGTKIRLIKQSNGGAPAARNHGFSISKGKFIQFLDADDLLSPRKIEVQVNVFRGKEDCIANGRWGRFYSNDPLNEKVQWGPHPSLQEDLNPVEWLCKTHMSQTACWLTPRTLIEMAGPWDESLVINQDGEFFTRVVSASKKVYFCDEAKIYYRSRLRESITSRAKSDQALDSFFRTCQSFEKVIRKLEDTERTWLACANKYQEFVYSAFPVRMDLVTGAEKKIQELGGSTWPPYKGSSINHLLTGLFGWKFPARLRHILR